MNGAPPATDFDSTVSATISDNQPSDITTHLATLSTSTDVVNGLQQDAINATRARLAAGDEYAIRLEVAQNRQLRQARNVSANLATALSKDGAVSPETKQLASDTYNAVVSQRVEDNARTSIEREAIDRIHDNLATGDTVEAKLTYDLMFGRGNATKVWFDSATKNMLLAQKLEQIQGEAKDQSWGREIWNGVMSLVPFNSNFANTGIVEGEGTGGLKNWLLSGSSLQSQSEAMLNKYASPEDFADALKNGGELDLSIRDNATTAFGNYDPRMAESILAGLDYQTESDKQWSNAWSLFDPATVALPWLGKGARVPGMLQRLGTRSAARSVLTGSIEDIIANGAEGAAKRTGVSEAEAVEGLEVSAMKPGTPNDVPLAVDVNAQLEAVAKIRAELPNLNPPSSLTNTQELADAITARVAAIEKEVGRPIKDVKYFTKDVATGERSERALLDPLPENGNVVHQVEVTWGKKTGGGYAKAKTAISEMRAKLGVRAEAVEVQTVKGERKVADPDFNIVAYHGTADEFDKFDEAFAGKLTDAQSAKMAFFATDNPDVAWTYAVEAARDRARSLEEVQHYGGKWAVAADELRVARNELSFKYFNGDETALREQGLTAATADKADIARWAKVQDDYEQAKMDYDAIKNETSVSGQNIRPMAVRLKNPYVHDYADELSNGYDEMRYSEIIEKAKAEGHDGVILKNTNDAMGTPPDFDWTDSARSNALNNHTIYAIFDNANIKPTFDAFTIERDVSGQFFGKATFDVPLDGFRTTALDTQKNGLLAPLRSDARRVDDVAQAKAVAAGSSANRLRDAIGKRVKESLKGISSNDRVRLDEIIRKGQNESRWLTDNEFSVLYERVAGEGKVPSERLVNAYKEYQFANDLDFSWRREQLYKADVEAGYENVKLSVAGTNYDGAAKVSTGGNRPSERVFNRTDGVLYNPSNPLTSEEWSRLTGEGYVLLELKEGIDAGGTHFRKVLVHRSEIERSPLELEKSLGYKAGGHRAYTGRYYLKQAAGGTQADNGTKFLKNPNVFRTGNNPNRLGEWARVFNRAIDDAKKGIVDAQYFDDEIFANSGGLSFPSGEEFLKAVDEGRIDLDHHVEVVGDRELPAAYRHASSDVSQFIDEEVDSVGGYYRTTGRMYTSSKGDALLDEFGDFAETVDPWETIDRSLGNISRMTSLSGYKSNIMERFSKTYGDELVETGSDYAKLTSKLKDGVPNALARKIKAEQAAAARIMGFKTSWDRGVDNATRELAEWVIGDATDGVRENIADAIYWLKKNNPVNYIRGLAFDAKLGFFNPGQFFLQSMTMAASMALSPTHGWKGFKGVAAMQAMAYAKGNEAVLDTLAKKGFWKLADFESEAEFKEFHRFVNRSGFMDIDGTMTQINSFGPARVFGSGSKFEAVREAGRIMFYKAEVNNRAVAARIAWEINKERGLALGSSEFRDNFVSLADDYSFNMTHESRASFQTGLLSIPTQFWAYNVRMMDAMMGNGFSNAAKARLVISQLGLYGLAGVPLGAAVSEFVKKSGGTPVETGSAVSYMDRGLVDNAINAVTGADIRFGERVGTGSFINQIVKDLFGMSEYGSKSMVDMLGGATFSIAKDTSKTLADVVAYMAAESGGDQGYTVTRDNVLKLMANISTIGNAQKAMLVANYGYLKSNKGSILANDLPKEDAVWVALGLGSPQELDNSALMKAYNDNVDDQVAEAAKVVRSLRQEAFLNPDKYQENMEQVNLFMRLQPAFVRRRILRQTNRTTDHSFYEHVETKYNKERMEVESANGESDSNPR